jgi:3-hydroxyisobutyrate dehydrogenase-like beta-hydroxyacid dehydrogenase
MTHKSASAFPIVGIYGLGIMGGTMAEALLKRGYKVCGFDIDAKAKQRFKKHGGQFLTRASDVALQADILIVSVSTSAALQQVTLAIAEGQRIRKSKAPPIVIETSTLTMADKNLCAKTLKKVGITTLDCPISGTAVRIKDRAWTIFASGAKTAFKKSLPVLEVFTDNVPYVGAFGNGTKLKFSANHLVAIYNVAYAESVALARKMGLDPREVLKLFGNSPVLGTGVMRLRMDMMVKRQYKPPTMKVEVWQKDMEVIGQMAKSVDCPTPLFQTCASIYTAAMAQGLSQDDTASTAEVFAKMAGLD